MTDRIKFATDLRECLEGIVAEDMGDHGVCYVIGHNPHIVVGTSALYDELVTEWPLYSGNYHYPVPDPAVDVENTDADMIDWFASEIYNNSSKEQMWDRATSAYAELRWQLIEWLIEQCKEIENEV